MTRTYGYDGDGLLRSRTVARGRARYELPVGHLDRARAAAPGRIRRVVHGLGPLYLVRADATTTTLVRDALGSVRAEANDIGLISKTFRYAAYGEVAQATPTGAVPTLLGFAGELRDPSGLIYLRARWYDPGTGRFMARDAFPGAIATPSSLNTYAYSLGSPTLRRDPSGLVTGGLCVTASLVVGLFGTVSVCPVQVASNGEIGWSATYGGGGALSPTAAASLTVGPQASSATKISSLGGPFTQVGGSLGEALVVGGDFFWGDSDEGVVRGATLGVGPGWTYTAPAIPAEVHAAKTQTATGVFFNIRDLLSRLQRVLGEAGSAKGQCGC